MFDLPETDNPKVIADWIELHLAVFEDSISKARMASILEQDSGDEPPEALLSSVWLEMSDRQLRYDNAAFSVGTRRITRTLDKRNSYEYLACLILSLYGVTDECANTAKLFERLSSLAIKEYLDGEVFVFGWPVLVNEPTAISSRIMAAAGRLNERFTECPLDRYKDRGVDIIAWKPFAEKRSCQFVVLAQCAAGKNWKTKTRELPINSWKQYIHWANDPVTAFFVPCIIEDDLWHDISREAGILFDRIRIINLLPSGISDASLNQELCEWIERRLAADAA